METCGEAHFHELLFRVAAAMPEHFVERAEKSRATGNQHDGHAAFFEEIMDVAQSAEIVGKMLQDIEEDYGIEWRLGGE